MTTTTTTTQFNTMDSAKFIAGSAIAATTAILNIINVTSQKLATDTKFGSELQASMASHGVMAGSIAVGKDLSQKIVDEVSAALAPRTKEQQQQDVEAIAAL